VQVRRHEVDVAGDRPGLRLADPRGEAHLRQVAVRGEAHVVELDLVEARPRRRRRDREVVLPGAAVAGVEPAQSGTGLPDRAVRCPDGEVGARDGEDRVLERDDAADQVDAVLVCEPRGPPGVVVRPGGADRARQLRSAADEPDLPALVLDVELEGVEPGQLQVLLEPPGQRRERLGHVDAPHLRRKIPDGLNGDGPCDGTVRGCPSRDRHRVRRLAAEGERPDPRPGRAEKQAERAEPPAADLTAALLPSEPPELVRIGTHCGGPERYPLP